MCGKIMTVLLIFVALNCSVARYSGRLHCIVGVLPTCYKRKAATYFYPPGGTGLYNYRINSNYEISLKLAQYFHRKCHLKIFTNGCHGNQSCDAIFIKTSFM